MVGGRTQLPKSFLASPAAQQGQKSPRLNSRWICPRPSTNNVSVTFGKGAGSGENGQVSIAREPRPLRTDGHGQCHRFGTGRRVPLGREVGYFVNDQGIRGECLTTVDPRLARHAGRARREGPIMSETMNPMSW